MHLSCILVPIFLIVFNLVQSTPFREIHVLNRVPITVDNKRWFYKDKLNIKQKDVIKNSGEEAVDNLDKSAKSDERNEKKNDEGVVKRGVIPKDGDDNTVKGDDGSNTEKNGSFVKAVKPIIIKVNNTDDLPIDDDDKTQEVDGGNTEKFKIVAPILIRNNTHVLPIDDDDETQEVDSGNTEKIDGGDGEKQTTIPPSGEQIIKNDTESTDDKVDGGDGVVVDANEERGQDTTKEPLKQQDNAFQKYHAEKVSHMQEAMASNWPLGIIPYKFDTSSFDNILAVRVRDAMDFLESASCVQFKALSGRKPESYSWIHITNPEKQRECSHKPRRKSSGEIVLILGLECLKRRDILHSLLHAIGFNDEVTHPHRDQYIRIMWENVQPKYQSLFAMLPGERKVLVEYDPMSIMHFHDRAFSRNGQATIVPLIPGLQIQPSDNLSQLDKMKLRVAFGNECNRRAVDNLFDTCKTAMHEQSKGEEDKNYQGLKQEGKGNKEDKSIGNVMETKNIQDNKDNNNKKNENLAREGGQDEEYDLIII